MCASLRGLAAIDVLQLEVLDHGVLRGLGLLHARRQDLLEQLEVLELILLGELHIELDVEVTEVVVAVGRHTLALDNLDSTCRENVRLMRRGRGWRGEAHTRSDDLAWSDGHGQPPVIKMLNVDGTTAKSSEQVDLGLVEEVVVLALEARVGLLLNLENDVAGQNTGHLVTLAAELNLVAVLHTTVNVDVENLALHGGLLAVTALAAVLLTDDLTLAIAVGANGLESLDHGTHLAHHGLHTGTIAAGTRLDSTLLTTATITTRADDGLLKGQLRDLTAVDILEVDLVNVMNGTSLLGALVTHATTEHAAETTTAAEELSEKVLGAHTTASTAMLKTLLTKLVVKATLLGVGEGFVSVRQFLELLSGFGVVCVLVYEEVALVHTPRYFVKSTALAFQIRTYQGGTSEHPSCRQTSVGPQKPSGEPNRLTVSFCEMQNQPGLAKTQNIPPRYRKT